MISWSKVGTIASFEFLSTVKRKGYLIATFGMPLFLLLYAGLISGMGLLMHRKGSEIKIYGVLDRSGLLHLSGDRTSSSVEIPQEVKRTLQALGREDLLDRGLAWTGQAVFRPFEEEAAARAALSVGEIDGYFLLPEDYLQSGILLEYLPPSPGFNSTRARRPLKSLLIERLLEGNVSAEIAKRIRKPIAEARSWTLDDQGEISEHSAGAVVARLAVPLVFTMLLFVALMMSSGYLVQGMAVEKENKVVEVLLSSANPDEVLAGKLLGLGGTGLLQIAVWFGMVIFSGLAFAAALTAFGVKVPWKALTAGPFFFTAAYLFLGSLMLGVGSLGSTQRESQQFSMMWSLPVMVPLMFIGILFQDPHALPALIMTWIPFTAPMMVLLRLSLDPAGIAWWEVTGSLAVLAASTWLALRLGARLFRVGLLLTGARPRLREILRQAQLFG